MTIKDVSLFFLFFKLSLAMPPLYLYIAVAFLQICYGYLVDPPAPCDPKTIQDCSNWAVVKSSDTCSSLAQANGITTAQFAIYVREYLTSKSESSLTRYLLESICSICLQTDSWERLLC
jgi:hypothetical protein